MKLGFYYHSNYVINSDNIIVPGYIGVFIDALAKCVDEVILFLEAQTDASSVEEDYVLTQPNIRLVSLGNRSPFYERLLFNQSKVNMFQNEILNMDALLIRVPSPLMPSVYFALKKRLPVFPFVVGNYMKGLWSLEQPFFRKIGVVCINLLYQLYHNRMIKGASIFVNSKELFDDNKKMAKSISLIKTTTLTDGDFYERIDTCQNPTKRILFTGRINFQKGLRELIQSVAILYTRYDIVLDIVGWEEKTAYNYQQELTNYASQLGIVDRVCFHGKKQLGDELNAYYRNAGIYAIPSYHEGFPRTIWESLANSLPVIASEVGSIPFYLTHQQNCLLIPPKDTVALTNAIETLLNNEQLRKQLITNGYALAKEVTLDKQTESLIHSIKLQLNNA